MVSEILIFFQEDCQIQTTCQDRKLSESPLAVPIRIKFMEAESSSMHVTNYLYAIVCLNT